MPNQRSKDKKQVSFWATKKEKELLDQAVKEAGFDNLADYLRWIAANKPKPKEESK